MSQIWIDSLVIWIEPLTNWIDLFMNQTDLFINQCIVCVCKTKIYYTIINIIKNIIITKYFCIHFYMLIYCI